jgi:DNA-binding NtrC family response regulator
MLLEYPWPGNVRELKAVIERAALLCENATITPEDIVFANS